MYKSYCEIVEPVNVVYSSQSKAVNMPRLHYHNAYEIYFLEQGERNYIIHDQFFKITDGDFILISPFEIHKTEGGSYRRILVYFTQEYLERYYSPETVNRLLSCFEKKLIRPSKEETDYLKELLHKLLQEDESNSENTMFLHIGELLLRLGRSKGADTHEKAPKYKRIAEITEYLNRHYSEIENITEIADHFFITKYHLCRIFKEATGISLIEYLNNVKIKNACTMLSKTSLSVSQIGYECGFKSNNYFCNLFKKHTNMTPSEYRRQNS